ncbi:hypothetical protein QTP88_025307 [Uroleucon formosanum]
MALTLIPIPDVEGKCDELMSQHFFVENEELLLPLTDFFEETRIGWHKALFSLFGASHPTVWRLIDIIKKEQDLTELKINQLINRSRTAS